MRRLLIALVILAAAIAAAGLYITRPERVEASALPAFQPDVAKGRVAFYAGGCASCHATPGQDDRELLGGGVALKSDFGTFYAPNISPDPSAGIGRWSEADFVTAMWKGTSPAGEHYYPAFPYTSYQQMTLEDVRNLFAYIRTLKAVPQKARGHDVPFPFNIRLALGGWKFLYLDGKPFQPDPARDAAWNRGAYLANGPGHCAECHSPRDQLGGIRAELRFAGGPNPDGEGRIPNITPAGPLKDWTVEDIAFSLKDGTKPDGDVMGGSMLSVVKNMSELSDEDRMAIAVYLKSLPARKGP